MLGHLRAEDVRIVNYVFSSIAVLVTCFRLGDRMRTQRLWWDDAWAAMAMILLVVFMAAVEVHLQDPSTHSMRLKLIIAYMLPNFFYAVTWSSRMSILLTVIRISLGRLRKILVWVGFLFGITWAILFAQIWWVCEGNPNQWKTKIHPQCPLGTEVAVAQVITDVLSDAILILAPIRLVWRTKLTAPQKIRVIAIFSTTLATTAISLNHAYFVLKWGGLPELLAAVLQIAVSLIVANLSVLIAFFFRISTEDEDDTELPSHRHARRMGPVTRSLLFWQNWIPLPITSTFLTTGGVVRDRQHVEEKRRKRAKAAAAAEDPRAPTPASQITQTEPAQSVCHHGRSAGKATYETR